MTDDQRWDAMSCAGNRILRTPQMDRLASGGMRFSQAFVTNALCMPSRAEQPATWVTLFWARSAR